MNLKGEVGLWYFACESGVDFLKEPDTPRWLFLIVAEIKVDKKLRYIGMKCDPETGKPLIGKGELVQLFSVLGKATNSNSVLPFDLAYPAYLDEFPWNDYFPWARKQSASRRVRAIGQIQDGARK